ncbi:GNAT family N-acetyltransferase [Phycicoccus flavus]|uniref:GNAT family N-acetyltransferase n=1 Tax=Phycicoccus flavus TaxID=2502783 RepID=A0A8T6R8G9_9MICO|nr:GNAT family N-acetyltransferase [Phycicoccus flavus]NHA68501.1 GNAT family N-acetyltransferase [Phycicoccus flavus]
METTRALRVREAAPTDAFSVAALHLQDDRERGRAVPAGYLDTLADAWLRDRSRRTWLAEEPSGRPLGTVHGSRVPLLPTVREPAGARLDVDFLYVTADARGEGIGERLLRTLLDRARADGVRTVRMPAAPAARALYTRLGFAPPAERVVELVLG